MLIGPRPRFVHLKFLVQSRLLFFGFRIGWWTRWMPPLQYITKKLVASSNRHPPAGNHIKSRSSFINLWAEKVKKLYFDHQSEEGQKEQKLRDSPHSRPYSLPDSSSLRLFLLLDGSVILLRAYCWLLLSGTSTHKTAVRRRLSLPPNSEAGGTLGSRIVSCEGLSFQTQEAYLGITWRCQSSLFQPTRSIVFLTNRISMYTPL